MALAQGGFLLALFNLLPLGPLGGGRLAGVISPRPWRVGAPMAVALLFWRPGPMRVIVAVLVAPQVQAALRGRVSGQAMNARPARPRRAPRRDVSNRHKLAHREIKPL